MPVRGEDGRAVLPRSKKRPKPAPKHVASSSGRGRSQVQAGSAQRRYVLPSGPRGDSPSTRKADFKRASKYNEGTNPSVKRVAQYWRNHSRAVQLRETRVTETKRAQREQRIATKQATGRRLGPSADLRAPRGVAISVRPKSSGKAADPNLRRTQAQDKQVRADIKRVYTKGNKIDLRDKTSAAERLREKGIFAPLHDPKKPTYIKKRGGSKRIGGLWTVVHPSSGKNEDVHGTMLGGKFFKSDHAQVGKVLGDVAKAVVGLNNLGLAKKAVEATGDYLSTDVNDPRKQQKEALNKAADTQVAGLALPEKVQASIGKTFKRGVQTSGSAVLEGLDRPLAATESALVKGGIPLPGGGKTPGLVDLGLTDKKTRERIRKARGPLAAFIKGRDWRKDVTGAEVAQSLGLPKQAGLAFDLGLDPLMYIGAVSAPFTGGGSVALMAERIARLAPRLAKDEKVLNMVAKGDSKGLEKFMRSKQFTDAVAQQNMGVVKRGLERRANQDFKIIDSKGREIKVDLPSKELVEAVESSLRSADVRTPKLQPRIGLMLPTGRRTVRGRTLPSIPLTPDLGRAPLGPLGRRVTAARVSEAERRSLALYDNDRVKALKEIDDQIEAARISKEGDIPALQAQRKAIEHEFDVGRERVRVEARDEALKHGPIKQVDDLFRDTRGIGREARALHQARVASAEAGRMTEQRVSRYLDQALSPAKNEPDFKRAIERAQFVFDTSGGSRGSALGPLSEAINLTPNEQRVVENLRQLNAALLEQGEQVGTLERGLDNYTGMRIWENPENMTAESLAQAQRPSTSTFQKHRSVAAVSDYASRERMARTIERLADSPIDENAAFRIADQVHDLGSDRSIAELVAQRLERGDDVFWDDLTGSEKAVVDRYSRHGYADEDAPLFRFGRKEDEGRVFLENPEAHGFQEPGQLYDDIPSGDQRVVAMALDIKMQQQKVAAMRTTADPAYGADLDHIDGILSAKLREIGLPDEAVEPGAADDAYPNLFDEAEPKAKPDIEDTAEKLNPTPAPRQVDEAGPLVDEAPEPRSPQAPRTPAEKHIPSREELREREYVGSRKHFDDATDRRKQLEAEHDEWTKAEKPTWRRPAEGEDLDQVEPAVWVSKQTINGKPALLITGKSMDGSGYHIYRLNPEYQGRVMDYDHVGADKTMKGAKSWAAGMAQEQRAGLEGDIANHQKWMDSEFAHLDEPAVDNMGEDLADSADASIREDMKKALDDGDYEKLAELNDEALGLERMTGRRNEETGLPENPTADIPTARATPAREPEPFEPELPDEGPRAPQPDEGRQLMEADQLEDPIPPMPADLPPLELEPRAGRLKDARSKNSEMVELDPRVTGFYRARGQGLSTAFAARWQAIDKQRGISAGRKDLVRGQPGKDPTEVSWYDKNGVEYVNPHSKQYFADRLGIQTVPDGRLWPKATADALKHDLQKAGEYDQVFDAALDKGFQRTMGLLRGGVTTPFPAYHIRNLISDVLKSMQADTGVLFHPIVNTKLAMLAFNRGKRLTFNVPGYGKMNGEEFLFVADMLGAKSGHHMAEVARFVRNGKFDRNSVSEFLNKGMMGATKFGSSREDVARYATFFQRLRANGGDAADASWYMIRHHFNYNDLSAFERRVVRNAFLFYTWYRKNIPLQFAELVRRPGFFAGMQHTYDALAQGSTPMNVGPFSGTSPLQPALPDYVKDRLGAATVNWNGYALNVGFGAPWNDMNWLSMDGLGESLQILNPFITTGYMLKSKQDILTGRTYKYDEPSGMATLLDALPAVDLPKDEKGNPTMPWALSVFLRQLPIFGRGVSSIGDVPESRDQGRLQSWAKWLTPVTGINVFVSPKPGSSREKKAIENFVAARTFERQEVLERSSNQNDQIKEKYLNNDSTALNIRKVLASKRKIDPTAKRYLERIAKFDAETERIMKERGIEKYLKTVPKTGYYVPKARGKTSTGLQLGSSSGAGGLKLGG